MNLKSLLIILFFIFITLFLPLLYYFNLYIFQIVISLLLKKFYIIIKRLSLLYKCN